MENTTGTGVEHLMKCTCRSVMVVISLWGGKSPPHLIYLRVSNVPNYIGLRYSKIMFKLYLYHPIDTNNSIVY